MKKILIQIISLILITGCSHSTTNLPTATASLPLEPTKTSTVTPSPEPTTAYNTLTPMGLLISGYDPDCIGLPSTYLKNYPPGSSLENVECDFTIDPYRLYRIDIINSHPFDFIEKPNFSINYVYYMDRDNISLGFTGYAHPSEISVLYYSSYNNLQNAFSAMQAKFIPFEVSEIQSEIAGSRSIIGPLPDVPLGEQVAIGYKITWRDWPDRRYQQRQVDILFTRCGNLIFINDIGDIYLENDEIKIDYSTAIYYANNLDKYLNRICQE